MYKPQLFQTDNYLTVINACKYAHDNSKLICIVGETGLGKSIGLRSYCGHTKNAYYMKVTKSMGPLEFYKELLVSLGFYNQDKSVGIYGLMRKISWVLNEDKNKKLLVIDEAGKFTPGQLEYIHELRDETDETTGIILAGPGYFEDNLEKWKSENVIGIPELERRIYSTEILNLPTKREMKAICHLYEIKDGEKLKGFLKSENYGDLFDKIEMHFNPIPELEEEPC